MYSGTLLTKYSGRIIGTHQKIDRIAHKMLLEQLNEDQRASFPAIKLILHFEGKHGPDGIKTKSAGKDEPWHFYDPFNPNDDSLIQTIQDHADQLTWALRDRNKERAAFEASWLAHALVDGLTPAHHFPYGKELERIRGESLDTRDSVFNKLFIKGGTVSDTARRNWSFWGAKGLMVTHGLFEMGVAAIMAPISFKTSALTEQEILDFETRGLKEAFSHNAREIGLLRLFDRYYERGWTPSLAKDVRLQLAPLLIKTVVLAWRHAAIEASKAEPS